jgi:hypothetical protein
MRKGKKVIGEAQEILNRAMMHLNSTIHCKVVDYKHENYQVRMFTKENKLIVPVQIAEEWIKGTNPKENLIHDKLEMLFKNLERY